jgi:putative tricarboxylic transport membrane protein
MPVSLERDQAIMHSSLRSIRTGAALLLGFTPIFPVQAQNTWKPQNQVEISVPSAPGGGTDHTARMMQRIMQEHRLVEVPVTVNNKSGGGGLIALNYLKTFTGNAHYVQTASAVLLSNHIVGRSPVNYSDLTPLALLQSEYIVLAVKSDSQMRTAADLVERLKHDPASVSIAVGTTLGGANHSAAAALARAAGVDPRKLKTVVFKSSSESAVAALGGHVDVTASSASQVLTHVRSGMMRLIGVTAPKRLSGELATVPTLKEQGMNVEVNNFRFLIGPAGLTVPQIAFWHQVLSQVVQADEWRKDSEVNLFESTYMNSRDVRTYLDTEYAELKAVLTAIGLSK